MDHSTTFASTASFCRPSALCVSLSVPSEDIFTYSSTIDSRPAISKHVWRPCMSSCLIPQPSKTLQSMHNWRGDVSCLTLAFSDAWRNRQSEFRHSGIYIHYGKTYIYGVSSRLGDDQHASSEWAVTLLTTTVYICSRCCTYTSQRNIRQVTHTVGRRTLTIHRHAPSAHQTLTCMRTVCRGRLCENTHVDG